MVCRNALKDINETWYASCIYRLSHKWAVGLMGCRTNGPSDKWAVGLLGGPHNRMPLHVMEQPPRLFALAYRASDACIYQ